MQQDDSCKIREKIGCVFFLFSAVHLPIWLKVLHAYIKGRNTRLDNVSVFQSKLTKSKTIFLICMFFFDFIFFETGWNSMSFYVSIFCLISVQISYACKPIYKFGRLILTTCPLSRGLFLYWITSLLVKTETKSVIGNSAIATSDIPNLNLICFSMRGDPEVEKTY